MTLTLEQRITKAIEHYVAAGRDNDAMLARRMLANVQAKKCPSADKGLMRTFAWTENL